MRCFIIYMILWLFAASLQAQPSGMEAYHRVQQAITGVIVHDIFSPPVASRIYLYTSLAAYEASRTPGNALPPFHRARPDFPGIVIPDSLRQADPALSAAYASMYMARKLVFSEEQMQDSITALLDQGWQANPAVRLQSQQWALLVADKVWEWSKKDQYAETRKLRRYTPGRSDSSWIPTPPGYFAAVEPHWGKMRTVVISDLPTYSPPPPMPFSKDAGSPFYRQAYDVYKTVKGLSTEDSLIALFWDCNPFHLTSQGHLNFATKKLSPGGHWMSITGIACQQTKADIHATVAAYLAVSVALFDGFVSCWHEKYRSNLIRPETYINAYIDESWRPLLQTPPFPEYTSGHSVISGAASEVLTVLFGDAFAFDDDTETGYGLPVRSFTSFRQAAREAAISRYYGGIHYMEAIEHGAAQGIRIGHAVTDWWNRWQKDKSP